MLIYRDQKRPIAVRQTLASLRGLADSSAFDHDRAVELLIEFGQLEAGIGDALEPEMDSHGPILCAVRQVGLTLGRVLYHSWRKTGEVERWAQASRRALARLDDSTLPETVRAGVPEGYAYYALYPEMYLESAERFFRETRSRQAVVIGLRNIGTSLSAVVGATLQECGCVVNAYTVRPRGHPFNRYVSVSPALEHEWRERERAHFLIVDEGPGLSGSSFACVAEKISALGIPDERIEFFPSWEPDGAQFVSASARARWSRHKNYTTSFEQVWIESGQLARGLDVSGGKWRELLYRDMADYPAVQPPHERRKYLTTYPRTPSPLSWTELQGQERGEGAGERGVRPVLRKFVGLGRFGRERLARAQVLAEAGYAPRPLGLANGFLAMEFVRGQPLAPRDVNRELLEPMARYLAFVDRNFAASQPCSFELLMEMIRTNVAEGLGAEWRDRAEGLQQFKLIVEDARPVMIDGRMLPHEWLKVGDGYLKTDGHDHCDDHFFPGIQNTAWDIAGTCVEFGLDAAQRDYLIDRYIELANDRGLAARLPFYSIAYLAFRLGYATMAAQTLGDAQDGERFARLAVRYAGLLKREIGETLRVMRLLRSRENPKGLAQFLDIHSAL
ncbi:MAG: hypothetical protein HY782_08990 [Chloroflexi bacterium]|nr:hypothetical protein [Chloroflexota bacterium]